jgi:hypothetical protein
VPIAGLGVATRAAGFGDLRRGGGRSRGTVETRGLGAVVDVLRLRVGGADFAAGARFTRDHPRSCRPATGR